MNAAPHRVSLIVLAYNQERTVRAAVAGCLAQECEPIEIILSDDASSDGTFEIMRAMAEAYRGPHRVWARRNEANAGIGEHYNQLVAAASGELLVTAAGDDLSVPTRIRELLAAWESTHCKADLIASHVTDLDDDDRLHEVMRVDDLSQTPDVTAWAAKRPYIIGAGHAFTKRMMLRFGPMDREVFYEDQVMVFRAIASGGAITVDKPLVHYRRGGTSRKPVFESMDHMRRWTARQLGRELAEMRQLIADSQVAGCEPLMQRHLGKSFAQANYLNRMNDSRASEQRWEAYREAAVLPRLWRLRKMSHAAYPRLTYVIRRNLNALHAWRHRLGLTTHQHATPIFDPTTVPAAAPAKKDGPSA